jgi:hypothetical protein
MGRLAGKWVPAAGRDLQWGAPWFIDLCPVIGLLVPAALPGPTAFFVCMKELCGVRPGSQCFMAGFKNKGRKPMEAGTTEANSSRWAEQRRWRIAAAGFGLVEFLMSSLILLLLSAAVYEVLARVQRAASYQDEIQGVLESARFALESVARVIGQAGNDPRGAGFPALVIVSATEARVRSDLTGSAAPGFPDKGDPDGDCMDSGEDVTIRYSAAMRALEMASGGGGAQTTAANIASFRMQYFDCLGAVTANGNDVCKVLVVIQAVSPIADPQTKTPFGLELSREILLPMRR